MAVKPVTRVVLAGSADFKAFWQKNRPFRYALTSSEYPPVLLEAEEWLFSNDVTELLKELMQFRQKRMKFVKTPFNPGNKTVLRPEGLSAWQIINFPEEWNGAVCDVFVPEGHLTRKVVNALPVQRDRDDAGKIEGAFFSCLGSSIEQLGYILFKPVQGAKRAAVQTYLKEWERDESDAGLL